MFKLFSFIKDISKVISFVSAATSIISGVSALFSAKDEAKAQERESSALRLDAELQRQQSNLARDEANREAERIKKIRRAELGASSLRFIKGGVTLNGSPLFILKTQEELDIEEEKAIRDAGEAQRKLGFGKAGITEQRADIIGDRADITRNKGRSAFVGGLGQAAGSLTSIF